MSLLVAIQSAIFYYVACTPCNEARARHRTKKQAKQDRQEKMRIQMEQPGLYPHPSPYNTNPYWQEEIDMGPRPPKSNKIGSKNTSQRGLNSAGTGTGTGRDSTSNSLTCANSWHNEHSTTTIPASPEASRQPQQQQQQEQQQQHQQQQQPESESQSQQLHLQQSSSTTTDDEGWNRHRYQREDEELWGHGHDFSRMGHRLVDNIVKAGSSAGRMIKGDLMGKERPVTDDDRTNFYLTPKNPPVNEYHPPIVGSAPSHKTALQWMLQPPPPAKVMEGRVPVSRAHSSSSVGSRAVMTRSRTRSSVVMGTTDDAPLARVARERAMHERLRRQQETPSESDLIDALIGTRTRHSTLSSSQRGRRHRSLSMDSDKHVSDPSTDSELVDTRRRSARPRPFVLDSDDSDGGSDNSDDVDDAYGDDKGLGVQYGWDTSGIQPKRAAQRPKLDTIRSSGSNATSVRRALSNRPNGSRPGSVTPRRPSSPSTTSAKAAPLSDLTMPGLETAGKNENAPISVT